MVLFVEGPHDVEVLTAFIGTDLTRMGVTLIPMFGTRSMTALIESELFGSLGIPLVVLTDNSPSDVSVAMNKITAEQVDVRRLLDEASRTGRVIHNFGLKKRDITGYLSEAVCKQAAPSFPGWDEAARQWRAEERASDCKAWIAKTYGLALNRRAIRELAAATATEGSVAREFGRLVKYLAEILERLAPTGRW
jgi:hypothetical protein